MFDAVARAPDAPSGREVLSFLLTLVSTGVALAVVWQLGVQVVEDVKADRSVPVVIEFNQAPASPTPPTVAPPRRVTGPPRPPVAPVETTLVDPPAAETSAPVGPTIPIGVSITSGTEGPPAEGTGGGTGKGPDSGPILVASSAVHARSRVEPVYPEVARRMGITDARCTLLFHIDEQGDPVTVEVQSCPAAFQQSALDAAWAWRFYPQMVDGVARPAMFSLTVRYQLH